MRREGHTQTSFTAGPEPRQCRLMRDGTDGGQEGKAVGRDVGGFAVFATVEMEEAAYFKMFALSLRK
jgi:hypothetical protein